MNKPVITLVSVLKPIDDTRMYEKFGLSLGESSKYDVNIIGFRANKPEYSPNINFFPLPFFKRMNLGRFRAHLNILRMLLKSRPAAVILMAPELLYLAGPLRLFTGCKVLYDVQENYRLNIRTQASYSSKQRFLLLTALRLSEWLGKPFVYHYFLAEKIYADQLSGLGNATVLDNRFSGKVEKRSPAPVFRFLFTGTLGRHTGIMEAIRWTGHLYKLHPETELRIAGYAPEEQFRKELEKELQTSPWVSWRGIDTLVAHQKILAEIRLAGAGIINYHDHPSVQGKVPTKLYEYLALRLPILMSPRPEWFEITDQYTAAITVDFELPPEADILEKIKYYPFYTQIPGREVRWEDNTKKLLDIINNAL